MNEKRKKKTRENFYQVDENFHKNLLKIGILKKENCLYFHSKRSHKDFPGPSSQWYSISVY